MKRKGNGCVGEEGSPSQGESGIGLKEGEREAEREGVRKRDN